MPFNPSLPAFRTRIVSAELRENFTSLKALVDAQATQIAALIAQLAAFSAQLVGVVPVGTVLLWNKDMSGTPALPANFLECNGQVISDPASPYNGQSMPNYNGEQRFPRAGSTSGQTGGIDSFGTATAEAFVEGTPLRSE